jgi:Protein of unknown function (DUF3572)
MMPSSRDKPIIRDPMVVMLHALAWCIADEARASRLLAVTGLDADALRHSAGDGATLAAVGAFLSDHEPDLVACAAGIDVPPDAIIAAAARLGGE